MEFLVYLIIAFQFAWILNLLLELMQMWKIEFDLL